MNEDRDLHVFGLVHTLAGTTGGLLQEFVDGDRAAVSRYAAEIHEISIQLRRLVSAARPKEVA